ncbi:MAG: B12-binding domain-containing radical SAM protein [Candidatus Nitricoxidivorans perseverans]|uniref:B12-binding domain-containing radical SAM protein n=1 Tax=Candidatus Nitricoxidivorans perseverans TaxID=2975601 RepID=A0AA49FJQ9_9PROT|nr:MAG: B12-binding domain-containing radical SAM protein [Candidatus Nitricoxidivorans perseverans]
MAKILLINPSYLRTYGTNQAGMANPVYPVLSLATLAGAAQRAGHRPEILDLSYRAYDPEELRRQITRGGYDVVGITATSPLVNQTRDISFLVKDISSDIRVIAGGAHPSALPVETIHESALDAVVVGEGDMTIVDILDGKQFSDVPGICWRNGDTPVMNAPRPMVMDLDELAMPAWELYPVDEYRGRITKIIAKYAPLATIEFSRGCVFRCDFCGSKNTMGLGYRKKSPERCAEEMLYLQKLGYREALLTDDIFTSDNDWAVAVCEEFVRRGVKVVWTCTNGIRVDSANQKLFEMMKRAGCYRVHFGFESGNDAVLRAFGKGGKASLQQGIEAVRMARRAGLETWGMFMFGLSADTMESMTDTIAYAKKVEVDVMKFGITIPFPGTPMFNEMHKLGRIKTYDWDDYNVYNEANSIMDHPHLSWSTIKEYYHRAYVECYYKNPSYILRRFIRSIKTAELFWDAYFFVRFWLMLSSQPDTPDQENYAYRHWWEPLNIPPSSIRAYEVPVVRMKRPYKNRDAAPNCS